MRNGVGEDQPGALDREPMYRSGRLLRLLRFATGLSVEAAAVAAQTSSARVRSLETGSVPLGYLEGLLFAKAYLLCPNCFARHYRAAVANELSSDSAPTEADAAADEGSPGEGPGSVDGGQAA